MGENGQEFRQVEYEMVGSDSDGVIEGWTKASVYLPSNKRTSIWFYGSYKENGAVAVDDFNFVNCNSDPVPRNNGSNNGKTWDNRWF